MISSIQSCQVLPAKLDIQCLVLLNQGHIERLRATFYFPLKSVLQL